MRDGMTPCDEERESLIGYQRLNNYRISIIIMSSVPCPEVSPGVGTSSGAPVNTGRGTTCTHTSC